MATKIGMMDMKRWHGLMVAGSLVLSACGDDEGTSTTTAADSGTDTGTSTGTDGMDTTTGDDGSGGSSGMVDLPEGCDFWVEPSDDDQTAVQEALIDVQTGQTVCLAAGTFSFTRQLSLDANGVTVRGEGGLLTVLDFAGQISGANGMAVTGDDVTVADLQILNPPGDGIRADNVENITFDGMHVIWEAVQSLEAGAYGFYPVQSNGVTVRNCVVQGSRDAGVYVGQSTNILVEDNEARGNVAGIEIENSTDAVVRRNWAHGNTAGILVFNLPGLDIGDGKRANIYENIVEDNNVPNFGEPGTVVALLPYGIGVIVLAADDNEVWNNEIRGNDSAGIINIAYVDSLFSPPEDPEFDIYAESNWYHDNTFENNGQDPDDLILLINGTTVPAPDIVYDGCFDVEKDNSDGSLTNCLSGSDADTSFMSVDLCSQGEVELDPGSYLCEHEPLPTEI